MEGVKIQETKSWSENKNGVHGQAKNKPKCRAITEDTGTPCRLYARKEGFCNTHYEIAVREGLI